MLRYVPETILRLSNVCVILHFVGVVSLQWLFLRSPGVDILLGTQTLGAELQCLRR